MEYFCVSNIIWVPRYVYAIVVSQVRFECNNTFFDCLFNLLLNLSYVMALLFESFPQRGQQAFRSLVIFKEVLFGCLIVV